MVNQLKRRIVRLLARYGYSMRRIAPPALGSGDAYRGPYVENDEYGPSNLQAKLQRVADGGPFELPDIINLNRAVMKLAVDVKRIVEIGAGTGIFSTGMASDESVTVVASELEVETHRWASEQRPRPNITYLNHPPTPEDGPFDLVVAVEVIEHVADFNGFLGLCAELAPRALLTTPNRARSNRHFTAGPPHNLKHVREWTAGEFYWVLRCYYDDVRLYGMESQEEPRFVPITVDGIASPMIADCRNPIATKP
jgi:hypothetical protein